MGFDLTKKPDKSVTGRALTGILGPFFATAVFGFALVFGFAILQALTKKFGGGER